MNWRSEVRAGLQLSTTDFNTGNSGTVSKFGVRRVNSHFLHYKKMGIHPSDPEFTVNARTSVSI